MEAVAGHTDAGTDSARARVAFGANATVAWLGVGLNIVFSILDMYDDAPAAAGLYGNRAAGLAGAAGRVFDSLSYFTLWSNLVVGVALTLMVARPLNGSFGRRVLHLDALLMISVTGIVYRILLAPTAHIVGVGHITNALEHIITPIVTILVWLIFGPRGWINARAVFAALGLPLLWIVFVLIRGAIDGTYPYDFANVTELGYGPVLRTFTMVLIFGVFIELMLWGVDRVLVSLQRRRPNRHPDSAAPS